MEPSAPPENFWNRFNLRHIFRSSIFWIVLIVLQLVGMYLLTYWGYHNSRLPYWMENYIQNTEIWKIYGRKSYGEKNFNDQLWIDPRLDSIRTDLIAAEVKGFLHDKKEGKDGKEIWVIKNVDEGEETFEVKITENTKVYAYKSEVEEEPLLEEDFSGIGRAFSEISSDKIPIGCMVDFKNSYRFNENGGLELQETNFVKVESANFEGN